MYYKGHIIPPFATDDNIKELRRKLIDELNDVIGRCKNSIVYIETYGYVDSLSGFRNVHDILTLSETLSCAIQINDAIKSHADR